MFALTKKTDYAIIALSEMARRPGEIVNAREIAERFSVPAALLVKVLKMLANGELIRSNRGVKGGYALALPAQRITLASIISIIEGPAKFVQCATDPEPGESPCELAKSCPVTRPMRKVHERLTELLEQVTLAELAFDGGHTEYPVAVSVEGHAVSLEQVQ